MAQFLFNIAQAVRITVSGERGEVIGRAEYKTSCNSYLVRYRGADGQAREAWWTEDALESAE